MPLTRGERYTIFLLLATQRGTLRQLLEGTNNVNGGTPGMGPAGDPGALATRAKQEFINLGIPAAHVNDLNHLTALFDPNVTNHVTTDQQKIAFALDFDDYGGTCPKREIETKILQGISQQLPLP
ncbi:MAG TPA: hypothetical protein VN828_07065 [Acidobacteriaceae bacterium]|nr:hypothetical protein [Acidobacteriaceae bacterium]